MRRYKTYREYLKGLFGEKVQKVYVDAGFTCPNRDGVKGVGGCTFCDVAGSGSTLIVSGYSVAKQVQLGIEQVRQKDVGKFIAYFQAFTNTYAPVEKLKELYAAAIKHPQIVGLAIGTRPDCVSDAVLDLLNEFQQQVPVWLEYGLQTKHNQTLEQLNRGHTAEEFVEAVLRTQERGIPVTSHLILGLPGETFEMMIESAQLITSLNTHGIKIQNLYLEEGMKLTEDYKNGKFSLMDRETYIKLVCDILEILPPGMVIERLSGEPNPRSVFAPKWGLEKAALITAINRELEKRNSTQGKCFSRL